MALAAEQLYLPLVESRRGASESEARPVRSALRRQLLAWGATPIFDEYWRFAVERQQMLVRRMAGVSPPWTDDTVLARHRFTNPYRFSDRVSQYLLREVQYDEPRDAESLVLRTLLFKFFNRIETWNLIREVHGDVRIDQFDPELIGDVLEDARRRDQRIYSAAYIVPNPNFGAHRKHVNHLRLLSAMISAGSVARLARSRDLQELYDTLITIPSLGPFLAFQFAVDLNYSTVTGSDELDFVVAGPGARDGIRKCFANVQRGQEEALIYWVADTQHEHLDRLGLSFPFLYGRALRPIDCQNLFCEVDKYARAKFPDVLVGSGRTRIKQSYSETKATPLPALFAPPKWRRDR